MAAVKLSVDPVWKRLTIGHILIWCTVQLMTTESFVDGSFSLYLNESETKRLLGVPGELFYVKEGSVNDYALAFNLPITNDVTEIYFGWMNDVIGHEPEEQLQYNISIFISNLHAMYQPTASIPLTGQVPNRKSSFNIKLLCTGLLFTDVDVKVLVNVSSFKQDENIISVTIKRKKTCVKGMAQTRPTISPTSRHDNTADAAADLPSRNKKLGNSKDDDSSTNQLSGWPVTSSPAFFVGIGCALGFVVVCGVVIVTSCLLCRRCKHKNDSGRKKPKPGKTVDCVARDRLDFFACEESRDPLVTPTGMDTLVHSKSLVLNCASPTEVQLPLPPQLPQVPSSPLDYPLLKDIRIEPCRLTLKEIVLQGSYSCTCRGTLATGSDCVDEKPVFVKMIVSEGGLNSARLDRFVREGTLMSGLQHDNINNIVAACVVNTGNNFYNNFFNGGNGFCNISSSKFNTPLLIYPYMNEGNLKYFLQTRKQTGCLLSLEQLMCLTIQLAAAIQYLHRACIIHRDIAARNCLIDSCMTLKLGDSALSRDLFPNDYDCTGCYSNPGVFEAESRPCKWMAVESLAEDTYSKSSDVWSFGVTIWELLTLGQIPYSHVDNSQLLLYLRNGYRLPQPAVCPQNLYAIMNDCWSADPGSRPEVSHLQNSLHNLCMSLVRRK